MPVILGREESRLWLAEYEEFPETAFVAMLQTPVRQAQTTEAVIEGEPSPQLSLALA